MPKTVHKRRRQRINHNQNKKRIFNYIYVSFGLVFAILLIFFLWGGKIWNKESKIVIASSSSDNSPSILILDRQGLETTKLIISGDTEVSLSRNLGILRLKNVWSLGENEKSPGDIFVKTISKNFLIPIYLFSKEDPGNFKRFIIGKNITNIGLIDRIKIYFFIKKNSMSEIDLAQKLFIKKEKLTDGGYGYRIYENLFERLNIYFNDQYFSDNQMKIYLQDATGRYQVAENVGKTLEVLGGKIVSIDRIEKENIDCEIWGKNEIVLDKIALFLSCSIKKKDLDGDITIKLGEKFSQRY